MNASPFPEPAARPPLPPEMVSRVEAVVESYLERLQADEHPEPYEFLQTNPELADVLEPRLEAVERLFWLGHEAVGSGQSPPSAGRPDSTLLDRSTPVERRVAAVIADAGNAVTGVMVSAKSECTLSPSEVLEALGRYRIRRLLGRGASGVVYQAYDPKFDREVALKVVRFDQPAGSEAAERFERDARIAAQLRHPHIVPLHEAGEQAGRRYIDMELIRGETLEALLQGPGRLEFRKTAELVRKLALALDYAHQVGIVHRDVKPSNILMDEHGEPQLTDFGLAHRLTGEESITLPGQILGTPTYMSPEQAQGKGHEADARSDIYSLGVILYRLLTGRLPFEPDAGFAGLLAQIVQQDPPRPCLLNRAIPVDLETICLKALEKEPGDRFRSAGALADELWRWLQDEPLTVRPPTWRERVRRWARRHRAVARILAAAALLVLAVSAVLGGMAWQAYERAHRAEVQTVEAQVREVLQAESRAEVEVRALLDQARERLRTPAKGRRQQAQEILRRLAQPLRKVPQSAVKEQLRLKARSLYALTLGVPELEILAEEAFAGEFIPELWRVAMHPNGRTMVIGTHLGPVAWTMGEKLKRPAGLDANKRRPRLWFSPDGRFLAFAPETGGLEIWNESTSRRLVELEPAGSKAPILAVAFGGDGKTFRACREDGQVGSWSLPDFERRPTVTLAGMGGAGKNERTPLTAAIFTADAGRLAVGDDSGRIQLLDAGGKQLREMQFGQRVEALAWSPDQRIVAAGRQDGIVQLWQADGVPLHRLLIVGNGVSTILFHPDGHSLWVGGHNGELKMWDVATGQLVLTGGGNLAPWGFSGDGGRLAVAGNYRIGFCATPSPQVLRTFSGHHAGLERFQWARDSRHLHSVETGLRIHVWDVERPAAGAVFQHPLGPEYAANLGSALSDDARFLVSTGWQDTILWHVATGKPHKRWSMSPALGNRLVCRGQSKFLLLREEKDPWRSVAYEIDVQGPALKRLAGVRTPVEGEKGFYSSYLTPDGRYFLWIGPRLPRAQHRAEVWDVVNQRRIVHVPFHTKPDDDREPAAILSADGRFLSVHIDGVDWLHDLAGKGPAQKKPAGSSSLTPAGEKWRTRADGLEAALLYRGSAELPWLELPNLDGSPATPAAISPDGRFLAWGNSNGPITVADLAALEQEIRSFEQSLPK